MPGNWNVNERGANDIAVMRKKLDVKAAVLESSYKRLLGASVEYGEDLGLYDDVVQAELKVIEALCKDCREGVNDLCSRLKKYEDLIRKELEKAKKEEEAASASSSTGGRKNAR